jgi:hypothetical protein
MEKDMLLKIVTKAENKELFNSLTKVEKKTLRQKNIVGKKGNDCNTIFQERKQFQTKK